jgi:hypothetical protein
MININYLFVAKNKILLFIICIVCLRLSEDERQRLFLRHCYSERFGRFFSLRLSSTGESEFTAHLGVQLVNIRKNK